MLFLRRASRRIKTAFWECYYKLVAAFHYCRYRYLMSKYGFSEKYIRAAFRHLVELNIDELRPVDGFPGIEGRVLLFAMGNMIKVRHEVDIAAHQENQDAELEPALHVVYEAVLNENAIGQLYLHEWNEKKRFVNMEYGSKFETNWYETFRTGRLCEVQPMFRFMFYLKNLYGEGPKNAV